jgi:hypothetical protein
MIQLQARAAVEEIPAQDLSNLLIEPVTLVTAPGLKFMVLAQNPVLVELLDSAMGLIDAIASKGVFENGGWRVVKRNTIEYQADRVVYDCLALRAMPAVPAKPGPKR